jgi:NAD(P)-dependent dehydrogenase (short-subunit alcohol dehydrogenase family)
MSQKLSGKIALVTGGSSGLGLATAKRFIAEGAYAAVKELGPGVAPIRGDISSLADLDRLFAAVEEQKGRLDVLFANAGLGEFAALGQITEAHFDKTFGVNVRGTLFTVQKALPLMPDGSTIVVNGSMVSVKGIPAFGVYAATKAALRSFARTWAGFGREQLRQRRRAVRRRGRGPNLTRGVSAAHVRHSRRGTSPDTSSPVYAV